MSATSAAACASISARSRVPGYRSCVAGSERWKQRLHQPRQELWYSINEWQEDARSQTSAHRISGPTDGAVGFWPVADLAPLTKTRGDGKPSSHTTQAETGRATFPHRPLPPPVRPQCGLRDKGRSLSAPRAPNRHGSLNFIEALAALANRKGGGHQAQQMDVVSTFYVLYRCPSRTLHGPLELVSR
jgi:hypothetical protein